MSREPMYGGPNPSVGPEMGHMSRSSRPMRRSDVPTFGPGGSPSKPYMNSISQPPSARGSPISSRNIISPTHAVRRGRHYGISRSSNNSPLTLPVEHVPQSLSTSSAYGHGFPYYDDPGSPIMDTRTHSGIIHGPRSRSGRVPLRSYHSMDREPIERDYLMRDPRDRSFDRIDMTSRNPRTRERSLDRSVYLRDDQTAYRDRETIIDDPYRDPHRGVHTSLGHSVSSDPRHFTSRDSFVMELQARLNELQSQYGNVKRELDATTQKLGSSMHSIKTFWSPELKKERALRKEEAAKYALINDQLKILRSENQKQAALIRQLEEELRITHMRNPEADVQQHIDALYSEKEHMSKEIYLLRETIKELELRIETQKQTLAARDESIKKLMEMMQSKGIGGKIMEEERMEYERLRSRNIELETRLRHIEHLLETKEKEVLRMEELKIELNKRDQEILALNAKMKTLEEQHQDYQRHIAVLKESLCAKEEHYNMLQADVEELRTRLEEKNKLIEKKTQQTMAITQEKNKFTQELQELRDHIDIKDRKINVLQRKIENLEDLLKEKDNQVDMARARLTAMQAHHSTSEGALTSLEDAISDKDKQIAQIKEQRDRAEQERNEERDLHERQIAEYKMKAHSLENEMEKLQHDLQTAKQQLAKGVQQQTTQQNAELTALRKQLDERAKALDETEKKLKKRQSDLDQMEVQLQNALKQASTSTSAIATNEAIVNDLRKKCEALEKDKIQIMKEMQKTKEESNNIQSELERLLKIMSTSEEEKFALNKQIQEMQNAFRASQSGGSRRNTQSAQMLEESKPRTAEQSSKAQQQHQQQQQQQQQQQHQQQASGASSFFSSFF